MSKLIELYGIHGKGKFAIISDEDYDRVIEHKWRGTSRDYVVTSMQGKLIYLHRFVMNTPIGLDTDHINGNKLDNRKENLRICTNSQNQANTGTWNGHSTKGVYYFRRKWVARISFQGTRIFLGRFENKRDALSKYSSKYKELFGEFARTFYE
jgi:hypothetical protein